MVNKTYESLEKFFEAYFNIVDQNAMLSENAITYKFRIEGDKQPNTKDFNKQITLKIMVMIMVLRLVVMIIILMIMVVMKIIIIMVLMIITRIIIVKVWLSDKWK